MKLNQVSDCPICGSRGGILGCVRTIHPDAIDEVELRECGDCGHWWHSPVPDQEALVSLYESASPYVVGVGARESYAGQKGEQPFHQFVRANLDSSHSFDCYLEIGAGGGHLLRYFQGQGHECYGVDPAQWVRDPAIYSNLEALPKGKAFGIFVLQDVLEHVVDPLAILGRLHSMAAAKAVLFASFPSCESRPARRFKGAWNMIRPYGHLHYFSRESARRTFYQANWAMRNALLSRHQDLMEHLRRRDWRALVYECLKGGRDQLYVQANS